MKLNLKNLLSAAIVMVAMSACSSNDAPAPENDGEQITRVEMIFQNVDAPNEAPLTALAVDEDGPGVKDFEIKKGVELKPNTTYDLSFKILNEFAEAGDQDIAAEIKEEGVDHQFYFAFPEDAFTNPKGDGNIDAKAEDAVNYKDQDANGLPIGLETTWTTGEATTATDGEFHLMLKHQPEIKSATSTSKDGESDIDLKFPFEIK